jgi:NMD protein affecting ribosome stability and mRNA decay
VLEEVGCYLGGAFWASQSEAEENSGYDFDHGSKVYKVTVTVEKV